MPVSIECVEVSQRFGTQVVLDGVCWSLAPGALAGFVGASGAGKTSLLRIIAGLDSPRSGRVTFSGKDARTYDRPPVGMVFQNLGLWPHLTVRRQVECLLNGLPRRERALQAEALLDEARVPCSAWDRRPAELSGGEAQRLALARALAPRPEVLLLDEPLAQLDMVLRSEMLDLIRQVARARGTTVIYVTHSWPEVLELCDQVAVLVGGRLAQSGPLDVVYHHPASPAIARLTGPVCEVPRDYVEDGVVAACGPSLGVVAEESCFVVRPQQVHLAPAEQPGWRVSDCRPCGAGWRLTLEREARRLRLDTAQHQPVGAQVSVRVRAAGGPSG